MCLDFLSRLEPLLEAEVSLDEDSLDDTSPSSRHGSSVTTMPVSRRSCCATEPLVDRVSLQALARSRGRVVDWTNDGGRALHTAGAIALSLWGLGRGCPIHDCDVARRGDEQVSEHLTDVVADTPTNRTG
ncbi:hypothetical protein PF008_g32760 [Phytophthora fragariae]|uniref:Uncharacterized protein n=1 Tax=Phytophthora fragariae TaxID=53985 RepID=A0A6G0PZ18_9STRA|nr:hypothetical protein PF008_g32760 [Phytophthora fragariae]